ncbi:MAG: hypothetical protein KDA42_09385 [Planctomycetales bacterium]|nr:hypothetical protein [Planctomycetales bacterium]
MVTSTTSVRDLLAQFEDDSDNFDVASAPSLNRNATSLDRFATERRYSRKRSGGSSAPRGPRRRLRKAGV